ncbi:hypothetical protein JVT61DRAFT_11924 [Boletus reticuloceps]|uniref:Uncharacterized protein n=1 Tax=Boletus reticuloceps TaxID=495285 RepID=A0A8I2YZI3_9AGAM|nr:hypothetical protein JVT61DRAFT_11924 [Boletus reticuloceps]
MAPASFLAYRSHFQDPVKDRFGKYVMLLNALLMLLGGLGIQIRFLVIVPAEKMHTPPASERQRPREITRVLSRGGWHEASPPHSKARHFIEQQY